jgi:hypothetical protein
MRFVCPWGGVPPSIEIQFEGAQESSAQVELSFRFCYALLQHLQLIGGEGNGSEDCHVT